MKYTTVITSFLIITIQLCTPSLYSAQDVLSDDATQELVYALRYSKLATVTNVFSRMPPEYQDTEHEDHDRIMNHTLHAGPPGTLLHHGLINSTEETLLIMQHLYDLGARACAFNYYSPCKFRQMENSLVYKTVRPYNPISKVASMPLEIPSEKAIAMIDFFLNHNDINEVLLNDRTDNPLHNALSAKGFDAEVIRHLIAQKADIAFSACSGSVNTRDDVSLLQMVLATHPTKHAEKRTPDKLALLYELESDFDSIQRYNGEQQSAWDAIKKWPNAGLVWRTIHAQSSPSPIQPPDWVLASEKQMKEEALEATEEQDTKERADVLADAAKKQQEQRAIEALEKRRRQQAAAKSAQTSALYNALKRHIMRRDIAQIRNVLTQGANPWRIAPPVDLHGHRTIVAYTTALYNEPDDQVPEPVLDSNESSGCCGSTERRARKLEALRAQAAEENAKNKAAIIALLESHSATREITDKKSHDA